MFRHKVNVLLLRSVFHWPAMSLVTLDIIILVERCKLLTLRLYGGNINAQFRESLEWHVVGWFKRLCSCKKQCIILTRQRTQYSWRDVGEHGSSCVCNWLATWDRDSVLPRWKKLQNEPETLMCTRVCKRAYSSTRAWMCTRVFKYSHFYLN